MKYCMTSADGSQGVEHLQTSSSMPLTAERITPGLLLPWTRASRMVPCPCLFLLLIIELRARLSSLATLPYSNSILGNLEHSIRQPLALHRWSTLAQTSQLACSQRVRSVCEVSTTLAWSWALRLHSSTRPCLPSITLPFLHS